MLKKRSYLIFKEFRRGVFYEDLYEKYNIDENILIDILNHNVKGRYDYKRILSGGLKAQKQFISHLKSRWNPLGANKTPNTAKSNTNTLPYIPEGPKKTPIKKESNSGKKKDS